MIKIEFKTSKFILTRLVIPVIIITIFLYALNLFYFHGSNGIVINLISDFIVILISAIFVSWVLNENQKRIWNETDSKIKFKIQYLINDYNSSIRDWLNYPYPTEILDMEKIKSGNDILISEAVMDFTKETVLKEFDIKSSGDVDWDTLFNGVIEEDGINYERTLINEILMIYNNRISPELLSKLIDLDRILFNETRMYETSKHFENDSPFVVHWRKNASKELKKGLEITLEIYKLIN
jgi:hypothetical protein